jgi:hypothetical protein
MRTIETMTTSTDAIPQGFERVGYIDRTPQSEDDGLVLLRHIRTGKHVRWDGRSISSLPPSDRQRSDSVRANKGL